MDGWGSGVSSRRAQSSSVYPFLACTPALFRRIMYSEVVSADIALAFASAQNRADNVESLFHPRKAIIDRLQYFQNFHHCGVVHRCPFRCGDAIPG